MSMELRAKIFSTWFVTTPPSNGRPSVSTGESSVPVSGKVFDATTSSR